MSAGVALVLHEFGVDVGSGFVVQNLIFAVELKAANVAKAGVGLRVPGDGIRQGHNVPGQGSFAKVQLVNLKRNKSLKRLEF